MSVMIVFRVLSVRRTRQSERVPCSTDETKMSSGVNGEERRREAECPFSCCIYIYMNAFALEQIYPSDPLLPIDIRDMQLIN